MNKHTKTLETEAGARLTPPLERESSHEVMQSAAPAGGHDRAAAEEALDWRELARIAFVALGAAAVWFRLWEPFSRISATGVVTALVGGWPIYKEALENLRERRMTMELSMTIALLAALAIGEFFTALVITAFVLAAEVLEGLTVGRGRRAIRALLDYLPATATVRRTGGPRAIPLSEVNVGEIVLVAPGERIAVDGIVRSGESYVDQATITGESTPVEKRVGAPVFAGTINQAGALEVLAERLGRDTSFGKIVDAVERAERSKAPVQKTADRYAGYLVYFALACAAVTYALTRDARSTISVIIVAGACGIAAGTPLAILGAIGRGARAGAIVKGGRYLEALWSVDTIAFDKTGTVTVGAPEVNELWPAANVSENELLEVAAIAEQRSEHPLARAIVRRATALGVTPTEPEHFAYTPGRGVVVQAGEHEIVAGNRALFTARGIVHNFPADSGPRTESSVVASEVLVARDAQFLGVIRIADTIRPEAAAAIDALRRMNIRTVLLSGDASAVVAAVGHALHMDSVAADLLPDQKVEAIRRLTSSGRTVAMVGDGVNDAPALSEATVGIAMGSGTDVARESADIVLLGNDLSRLVETVAIAGRTRRIIQFNFVGTLAVDAVGVGLAAFGYLNPLVAVLIHVTSELAFILNSARLLPAISRERAGVTTATELADLSPRALA